MNLSKKDRRVVVIAGGGRHVGKTTLAMALSRLLPNSVVVKLGEHASRKDKAADLLPLNTPYRTILESVSDFTTLILESGSVLDDPDLQADLVIFLPALPGGRDKPGSERRSARADVIRGQTISSQILRCVQDRLGTDKETTHAIATAIESTPLSPSQKAP